MSQKFRVSERSVISIYQIVKRINTHEDSYGKLDFDFKLLFVKPAIKTQKHSRCSVKRVFLKNFAKFTGRHLCQSLFFNNVAIY